jgi:two-component system KDP operon response regulator KdpE
MHRDVLMKKRILVVDDNARIGNMVRLLLQRVGYQVTTAVTGRQALEMISSDAPDLVLLDLSLPDLSGSDLLVRISKDWGMPVIVMSASVDTLRSLIGRGAADVIGKPFDPADLVNKVTGALSAAETPPEA